MSIPPSGPDQGPVPPLPDDGLDGESSGYSPQCGAPTPPGPAPYGIQPSKYGPPPGPSDQRTAQTLGVIGVVAGVVALPSTFCCWFVGWIPALVAIVTGAIGLIRAKDQNSGGTIALCIGAIVLGFAAVVVAVLVLAFGLASGVMDVNSDTY